MTVSPSVPAQAAANLSEAIAALRERGLRLTTPRRLVLEALFAAEGPVSAEYVARRLGLDVASVHRNFETLERQGLVRHVHLGHGPGLYALLGHGEREYLYCERCGAVRALAAAELGPVRELIRERYGYVARFDHFAIVGTCTACSHLGGARPDDGGQAHSHGDHVHAHPHGRRHGLQDGHER
jgi:Fur family transcriptional regulator, ferric uptake regulator